MASLGVEKVVGQISQQAPRTRRAYEAERITDVFTWGRADLDSIRWYAIGDSGDLPERRHVISGSVRDWVRVVA